jgi:hypothetical protein
MIILDTNVLSEPLKLRPDPKVLAWLDAQSAESLYITTIIYAELRIGVLRMPAGKRRESLTASIDRVLDLFRDRTLCFDIEAAEHLARIAVECEKSGKPATAPDAYIAAVAAARGFAVATRNVGHFEHTGVGVINPWD